MCREYTDKVFVVAPKGYCEPDRPVAVSKATAMRLLDEARNGLRSLKERIRSVREPLTRLREELRTLETDAMLIEDEKRRIMRHYYRLIADGPACRQRRETVYVSARTFTNWHTQESVLAEP